MGGFVSPDVVKVNVNGDGFAREDGGTIEDTGTFFGVKKSFNCRTTLTTQSSKIRGLPQYCAFDIGYVHHLPRRSDKMCLVMVGPIWKGTILVTLCRGL